MATSVGSGPCSLTRKTEANRTADTEKKADRGTDGRRADEFEEALEVARERGADVSWFAAGGSG
jgi:hypothetical protein